HAEIGLRLGVPLVSRLAVPRSRHRIVLCNALAFLIHHTKIVLSGSVSPLASSAHIIRYRSRIPIVRLHGCCCVLGERRSCDKKRKSNCVSDFLHKHFSSV